MHRTDIESADPLAGSRHRSGRLGRIGRFGRR